MCHKARRIGLIIHCNKRQMLPQHTNTALTESAQSLCLHSSICPCTNAVYPWDNRPACSNSVDACTHNASPLPYRRTATKPSEIRASEEKQTRRKDKSTRWRTVDGLKKEQMKTKTHDRYQTIFTEAVHRTDGIQGQGDENSQHNLNHASCNPWRLISGKLIPDPMFRSLKDIQGWPFQSVCLKLKVLIHMSPKPSKTNTLCYYRVFS